MNPQNSADRPLIDHLETLYFFDRPILFVARILEERYLVTLVDEMDSGRDLYLAVAADDDMLAALRENRISVRDTILSRPAFTVMEGDEAWRIESMTPLPDIPEDWLPATEVMLRLEPDWKASPGP